MEGSEKGSTKSLNNLLNKDNHPSFIIFAIFLILGILMILFDRKYSYVINIGYTLIGISFLFAVIRVFFYFLSYQNQKHKEERRNDKKR